MSDTIKWVYYERNQLVSYLSKIFPAWLENHKMEDTLWENDWRNIVFIQFPEGLFSWHFHDDELIYFSHLTFKEGDSWDGHSVKTKYEKLRNKNQV